MKGNYAYKMAWMHFNFILVVLYNIIIYTFVLPPSFSKCALSMLPSIVIIILCAHTGENIILSLMYMSMHHKTLTEIVLFIA